jgi:hypothetical protein
MKKNIKIFLGIFLLTSCIYITSSKAAMSLAAPQANPIVNSKVSKASKSVLGLRECIYIVGSWAEPVIGIDIEMLKKFKALLNNLHVIKDFSNQRLREILAPLAQILQQHESPEKLNSFSEALQSMQQNLSNLLSRTKNYLFQYIDTTKNCDGLPADMVTILGLIREEIANSEQDPKVLRLFLCVLALGEIYMYLRYFPNKDICEDQQVDLQDDEQFLNRKWLFLNLYRYALWQSFVNFDSIKTIHTRLTTFVDLASKHIRRTRSNRQTHIAALKSYYNHLIGDPMGWQGNKTLTQFLSEQLKTEKVGKDQDRVSFTEKGFLRNRWDMRAQKNPSYSSDDMHEVAARFDKFSTQILHSSLVETWLSSYLNEPVKQMSVHSTGQPKESKQLTIVLRELDDAICVLDSNKSLEAVTVALIKYLRFGSNRV